MKKIYFKTFGCRTNIVDTAVMQANLSSFSVCLDENEADVVVVNSCTVTNGADSGVRGYISRLKTRNPNAKVLLTGCGVEGEGKKLFDAGKLFGVFGHSQKEQIDRFASSELSFFEAGDKEHLDSTIVENFEGKSRAFLKVQEGCDYRCSYCIIPSARGDSRSYPVQTILNQARTLVDKGFAEFVLTGTNVGSYGKDMGSTLTRLSVELSRIEGVRRIRIGSVEPCQIDEEFLSILDEPWMARHLHIALQHVHDDMLKVMNRRNSYASDIELLRKIADKGYAIGTDFIVGHPGEYEEVWSESLRRFEALPLTHLHGFVYSPREGTPSAAMRIQTKGDVAKARLEQLNGIVKRKNAAFADAFRGELEVLVEENGTGLDQFFNRITVGGGHIGRWVRVDDRYRDGNIVTALGVRPW